MVTATKPHAVQPRRDSLRAAGLRLAIATKLNVVRRRCDRLKAAGLRPVQIWVPDTRAPGFRQECARQAQLIRDAEPSDTALDDIWAENSDTTGWTV